MPLGFQVGTGKFIGPSDLPLRMKELVVQFFILYKQHDHENIEVLEIECLPLAPTYVRTHRNSLFEDYRLKSPRGAFNLTSPFLKRKIIRYKAQLITFGRRLYSFWHGGRMKLLLDFPKWPFAIIGINGFDPLSI